MGADYINMYMSHHVTDKEIKEKMSPVPSNMKGTPVFGQLHKRTFIEKLENINIKP